MERSEHQAGAIEGRAWCWDGLAVVESGSGGAWEGCPGAGGEGGGLAE